MTRARDFNLQNNFTASGRIVKVNAITGVTASLVARGEDILVRSLQADIRTRSSGCWPGRNCNFMPDETRDREITTLPRLRRESPSREPFARVAIEDSLLPYLFFRRSGVKSTPPAFPSGKDTMRTDSLVDSCAQYRPSMSPRRLPPPIPIKCIGWAIKFPLIVIRFYAIKIIKYKISMRNAIL